VEGARRGEAEQGRSGMGAEGSWCVGGEDGQEGETRNGWAGRAVSGGVQRMGMCVEKGNE